MLSLSLELFQHLFKQSAHFVKVVYFLVPNQFLLFCLALVHDVLPVGILSEQGLFSYYNQVPSCASYCHIESSAVFDEAEVASADAANNYDVFLCPLERIHCAHLNVVHHAIRRLEDQLLNQFHLRTVRQDDPNRAFCLIWLIVTFLLFL